MRIELMEYGREVNIKYNGNLVGYIRIDYDMEKISREIVYELDKYEQLIGKKVYLEEMRIVDEYRAKGIGKAALKECMSMLARKGVDYIFLVPMPIDEEWIEVDVASYLEYLEDFYTSLGFEETMRLKSKNQYNTEIKYKKIR